MGVWAAWRSSAPPALLLAGLACSGAAPDHDDVPPTGERQTSEGGVAASSDSLRIQLEVPGEARAGAPVPMVVRVENISDRSIDLYLTGRPVAFDLTVTDTAGDTVWRRLEGAVIPAILQVRTLAPGATLELEDSWDQRSNAGEPVPAGDYRVRGEILAEDEPLATPEEILHIRES